MILAAVRGGSGAETGDPFAQPAASGGDAVQPTIGEAIASLGSACAAHYGLTVCERTSELAAGAPDFLLAWSRPTVCVAGPSGTRSRALETNSWKKNAKHERTSTGKSRRARERMERLAKSEKETR